MSTICFGAFEEFAKKDPPACSLVTRILKFLSSFWGWIPSQGTSPLEI